MKKSNIFTALLLLLILIVTGTLTYLYLKVPRDTQGSDASTGLRGETTGVFLNLAGEEISFDAHAGRVRAVTSWASWNPFSVQDLQTFNTVALQYKDTGVVFLAINRKESKEQAERFLSTLPPLQNIEFAIDTQDTFYTSIGGYAMPETVIYDDRGAIKEHKRGTMTESEFKNALEKVIGNQE